MLYKKYICKRLFSTRKMTELYKQIEVYKETIQFYENTVHKQSETIETQISKINKLESNQKCLLQKGFVLGTSFAIILMNIVCIVSY